MPSDPNRTDDPNVADDPIELTGGRARALLQYLADELVDDPDGVEINARTWRHRVSLELSVSPDDMGKVIGRRGRTAQAIRTVVRAAGSLDGLDINVDIVD